MKTKVGAVSKSDEVLFIGTFSRKNRIKTKVLHRRLMSSLKEKHFAGLTKKQVLCYFNRPLSDNLIENLSGFCRLVAQG